MKTALLVYSFLDCKSNQKKVELVIRLAILREKMVPYELVPSHCSQLRIELHKMYKSTINNLARGACDNTSESCY